jgi:hypothetical protein
MEAQNERDPRQDAAQAAAHIAGAHRILEALQEKIAQHPEISEAILKIEMALNILEIKTGGIL